MKNKDELRDELNELSPLLAKRKGMDEGFKVPKDYFSALPDEIMEKVQPKAQPNLVPQSNWLDGIAEFFQSLFQPRYALAYASVAILVVAGIYLSDGFGGNGESIHVTTPIVSLENISDEVLENYLADNIETIDDDILEEYFVESDVKNTNDYNETDEIDEFIEEDILDDLDLDDLEDLL